MRPVAHFAMTLAAAAVLLAPQALAQTQPVHSSSPPAAAYFADA